MVRCSCSVGGGGGAAGGADGDGRDDGIAAADAPPPPDGEAALLGGMLAGWLAGGVAPKRFGEICFAAPGPTAAALLCRAAPPQVVDSAGGRLPGGGAADALPAPSPPGAAALKQLTVGLDPAPTLLLCESGGDNLAANFSR